MYKYQLEDIPILRYRIYLFISNYHSFLCISGYIYIYIYIVIIIVVENIETSNMIPLCMASDLTAAK